MPTAEDRPRFLENVVTGETPAKLQNRSFPRSRESIESTSYSLKNGFRLKAGRNDGVLQEAWVSEGSISCIARPHL